MKARKDRASAAEEPLSAEEAASHVLEECRMVLPGVQALFGFQLIAVFSAGFAERLSPAEQRFHLAAIAMVVVAGALVMAPAAYHRQAEPRSVTDRFVLISSNLLLWSMLPLAVGICADVYLVGRVIMGSMMPAALVAATLFAAIVVLWFVLPRSAVLQRLIGREVRGPEKKRTRAG